jgi:hypothetical protein
MSKELPQISPGPKNNPSGASNFLESSSQVVHGNAFPLRQLAREGFLQEGLAEVVEVF